MAGLTPRDSVPRQAGSAPVSPGLALLAALSLIGGTAGSPAASAQESLRWKLATGETLRYTMEQQTTQLAKAQGQELKTSMHQTVDLRWNVKGVSDGVADMSQTIDRVRAKIEGPGQVFEFDSSAEKAPEGPIAATLVPMLKGLVGQEFSFKMDARGRLSDIKLPQKLLDSVRQANPASSGTAESLFSEESMKNLSLALPEQAVSKGTSWKQQSKVPMPMLGTVTLDKTYTYAGIDETDPGRSRITLDTRISLEPAADSNVAIQMKSQREEGEFAFDIKAGRVVASRVNDKVDMVASANGQEFEQSTDTVTKMTLAKPADAK
jgi:hypothetical protein